jgi:hypothetical protein
VRKFRRTFRNWRPGANSLSSRIQPQDRVVPLIFGDEEAKVMINELNSDWLECAVN